jgi:hypothetical protein
MRMGGGMGDKNLIPQGSGAGASYSEVLNLFWTFSIVYRPSDQQQSALRDPPNRFAPEDASIVGF